MCLEIYNSTSPNDNTGPLIVLIGNKADLQNERRVAEG